MPGKEGEPMTQTPEEKKLATVAKRIDTLEGRVNCYNDFMENLLTQGREYIAQKVVEDVKAYTGASYYAEVTDKFLTVLEKHKIIGDQSQLIMKLLECASYTKWIAEQQAGQTTRAEISRK